MSISPPLRRLSSTRSSSKESLINAYEAEEERIINILSRKLEQLREEKIELENVLEAESESHVNRLSREISALRLVQQQALNASGTTSPVDLRGPMAAGPSRYPYDPTTEVMLEAMRRENEQLRSTLFATEQDYIRVSRLNEIYREELISHRRRLGLPVDNLIGLPSSSSDPYSQPTHRRPPPAQSNGSSVSTSPYLALSPPHVNGTHAGSARVPIPRPPSQIRRPHVPVPPSTSTTPPSSSSASVASPFPFSPPNGTGTSATTAFTTPPSSGSIPNGPLPNGPNLHELTYPSVPPPSLSSSYGDPLGIAEEGSTLGSPPHAPLPPPMTIPRPIQRRDRDFSISPVDSFNPSNYSYGHGRGASLSPRNSFYVSRRGSFDRSGLSPTNTRNRLSSVERGARIAEMGTLVPRISRDNLRDIQSPGAGPGWSITAAAGDHSGGPRVNGAVNPST